jgi:ribosomal protein S27E
MHKIYGRIRVKYRWIFVDKKVNTRVMKITAEIVNGKCPTCDEFTMLVGLTKEVYRCMTCGTDLEQHVNGKIVYLPHVTRPADMDVFVKEWSE